MLDLTNIRAELEAHYDLAPSMELAQRMSDIHARMDRVMPFPDWAIAAPYVAAINRLKAERGAVVL
ncbi:MAG: quinolinate synthase NadA, partial [Paracoccus sp. (in: a-proteobacteria)]